MAKRIGSVWHEESFYGCKQKCGDGVGKIGVPASAVSALCSSPARTRERPTHKRVTRRRWSDIQVLFMPCVFDSAHFFIFLFFLCLLRMRFLAHLSLIFT